MAQCLECLQQVTHNLSCSRSKFHGRRIVREVDEDPANWPPGSVVPVPVFDASAYISELTANSDSGGDDE